MFDLSDVVWYKDDKLVLNTDNVKVQLKDEEKKTAVIIKRATEEDDATYVCKATSEIGLATTKAKLRVKSKYLHFLKKLIFFSPETFNLLENKVNPYDISFEFVIH